MSLSAKIINGLVVISALLIFSCKKKDEIGLTLQPQDNPIGTHFIDTLTINTFAVLDNDDIRTSQVGYLFAGSFDDEDGDFGTITAEAYVQLTVVNETQNVSGFSADSVVLSLNYDFHYGDTMETQVFEVRKVTDALDKDQVYNSISPAPAIDPTRLDDVDSNTFNSRALRPQTKTKKIYLEKAFGTDVLNFVATGKTNADFQNQFKGIAITPQTPGDGAVMTIDIANADSKILVYYDNGKSYELRLSSAGAEFSRVIGDRAGTTLASLLTSGNETNVNGEAYLQSGIGIRTKILFPYLSSLKTLSSNIAVNRAELIFEVNNTTTDPLEPVPVVNLVKLNPNGTIKQFTNSSGVLQDDVVQREGTDVLGHDNPLIVAYNKTSSTYTLNVSPYFHAMLNGVEENNGLMLVPYSAISNSILNKTAGTIKLKLYCTLID